MLEFKQLDAYNNTLDERTEEDVRLNSPIYCYVDVGIQASQRPGRVIRVCSNEASLSSEKYHKSLHMQLEELKAARTKASLSS